MPQPPQPAENLQDVIRRWFNREVRDYFSDLGIDETWDPDLNSPRSTLANVCRHQDDDSLLLTLLKAWFFDYIKNQPYRVPIYGIPVSSFQESRKFLPQINLFFQQDFTDVQDGMPPVTGEISFRLEGETSETITPQKAGIFANRIRASFMTGNGRVWPKGKTMASYSDWGKGYQLQLLVRNEADAKELIEAVLDIQQHTPNWSKLNISENAEASEAYPTTPGTNTIYGKSRRKMRRRPIANVRFMSAFLNIHGMPNPIVLADRTGTHRTALVTAF